MQLEQRYTYFHKGDRPDDQRTRGQRDRDRILYTSALRRLAGVTQVVSPREGHLFHNRLTHTLEVAQIGRRLAESLVDRQGQELAAAVGGVDPDVVEAACLAHDLGHPPFGHAAEEALNNWITKECALDGFEGNPQSFRIVTRVSVRNRTFPGLNLTCATLRAILKYPWFRETGGGKRQRKWGAYHTENAEFRFAKALYPGDDRKSAEAELMDWADDVAYAVHDVEDFYRSGLIPLDRLIWDESEVTRFLEGALKRWKEESIALEYPRGQYEPEFAGLMAFLRETLPRSYSLTEAYSGSYPQRAALRTLAATLIKRYVRAIELLAPSENSNRLVRKEAQAEREVAMCKELTWHYVINSSALATQRHGQMRVVEDLIRIYWEAANSRDRRLLPTAYREHLERAEQGSKNDEEKRMAGVRVVTDMIAGMTDQQALHIHQRLTGSSPGSLLDLFLR